MGSDGLMGLRVLGVNCSGSTVRTAHHHDCAEWHTIKLLKR